MQEAPLPRSVEEVKAMLESTEKGGVRNSIHNCLTVFQHDPELSGAVAKNLLTERIDLLKPIGRKRRTGSKAMTDTDMKYIRLYLEDTYGLTSEALSGTGKSVSAIACGTFWEPTRTTTPSNRCGCSCWEPSTGRFAPAVNLRSCFVWWEVREPGSPPSSGCWP